MRAVQRHDASWIAALVALNAIVLANALLHDPAVGYDAPDHLAYIETLAQGRLPLRSDTLEFFSPPLPYLGPALLRATGAVTLRLAGKAAQLQNVLLSIGLTWCLVAFCERLRPSDTRLKTLALLSLGALPVYYKTFAFARGEPMLAFLAMVILLQTASLLADPFGAGRAVLLGVTLGLAVLSRQWGFFLLPVVATAAAMAAWRTRRWRRPAGALVVAFTVAALTGGWFYVHLRVTFGTLRAFNRTPAPSLSLANQPAEFYLGLGVDRLFTDPVRPSFHNQLLPTFYSELWGDYWTTFVVRGVDQRDGRYLSGGALLQALTARPRPGWLETNRDRIAPYLGRVNLVSLPATLVMFAGFVLGAGGVAGVVRRRPDADGAALRALLFLTVGFSLAGYGWFLVSYPRADTIKASYMLHVWPAVAILTAEMIRRAHSVSATAGRALVAAIAVALVHASPVFLTRYPSAW